MLKAVLFDLDQTLIDWDDVEPWEDYQFRRFEAVLDLVHAEMHPAENIEPGRMFAVFIEQSARLWRECVATMRSPHVVTMMQETLKECGVPEEHLNIDAVMNVYTSQLPHGQRIYPDVRDVLGELRDHGLELGIITNAAHPMLYRDRELEAVGIMDLFPRCRISAADVGYLKPHRAIFDHALRELSLDPAEAVFVGDSLTTDVEGSQGIGMYGVWLDRVQDEAQVITNDVIPDGTINSLYQLLPLLDQWYPGWRGG
ncbi:MAG: HAD family hydrolase [Chloroflexi bacterium]|nr:HAD family hydrolase [Chloroflexota bacterium]